MKKIAVFCGSNFGLSDVYREGAIALGRAFAQQKIALVYGGTNKGLMKIVADTLLENGGEAHGIIPRALVDKAQQHANLTTTEIVATRSVRKIRMAEVSDGFIAMPGGIGTVEELFEMWVDAQFEGHKKPIGLYNVNGFYDDLLRFVQNMIAQKFLPPQQKDMVIVDSDPAALLNRMSDFTPITIPKWM
ncbi:MAG: TIGR00730 family Rossman fold protein [Xanthobacteraceae bacterium]|nr:TIGR00730 family Rossman fold protein [Xanthobacteraceae bacterium]